MTDDRVLTEWEKCFVSQQGWLTANGQLSDVDRMGEVFRQSTGIVDGRWSGRLISGVF
jgi:hypothetical protein